MIRRPLAAGVALLAGCAGYPQSPLNAAGTEASRIVRLGGTYLVISVVVYVIVNALLLLAVWRRRREGEEVAPPHRERGLSRAVGGGIAVTSLIILLYLVMSIRLEASLMGVRAAEPLTIEIVARQWWWEMRYQDSVPSQSFITANELHLPAGREVVVLLRSDDVIHSFWVPSLMGKRDVTPGHHNTLRFTPQAVGSYRGQCAEFCGFQHAHMAFDVVVEEPAAYQQWVERQRTPAAPAADSALAAGQQVFLRKQCPMCHAIQGTPARGSVGPDLTHVASRKTLAAGTIPNTAGHLATWITDPGAYKPGTRMPPNELTPVELQSLIAYIRSLE